MTDNIPEFFTDQGEDDLEDCDGYWYVYHRSEYDRPVGCRNPVVILLADQWTDDGKFAAHAIAAALSDNTQARLRVKP